MHGRNRQEWRQGRQLIVAALIAYAVLVQALASPVLRIKAAWPGGMSVAGILCLTGADSDQLPSTPHRAPHGHGLECCLPGLRSVLLDAPMLVVSLAGLPQPSHTRWQPAGFTWVEAQAPPKALATSLQARAPPQS